MLQVHSHLVNNIQPALATGFKDGEQPCQRYRRSTLAHEAYPAWHLLQGNGRFHPRLDSRCRAKPADPKYSVTS
jgi:hypothetical protein